MTASRTDPCAGGLEALAPAGAGPWDPWRLSPWVLAYIGDAVFELYARLAALQAIVSLQQAGRTPTPDAPPIRARALDRLARERTRAGGQARILAELWSQLDEQEREVVRRARNARLRRRPAGITPQEYRASTALEALVGFLYLAGRTARLQELLGGMAPAQAGEAGGSLP